MSSSTVFHLGNLYSTSKLTHHHAGYYATPTVAHRARGVQYVHWVMHKCIMIKVGGNTRKVCKKLLNFLKQGGN